MPVLKKCCLIAVFMLILLANNVHAQEENADEKESVWLPPANEYDWLQLTSGEWLKGEMKSMYSETLEFDSDKLDLLNIDWEDVKYLKSYRNSTINLDGIGAVKGRLTISDDTILIENSKGIHEYDRLDLISLTPAGEREIDLWAIDLTFSLNFTSGNTEKTDYTTKFKARRRTARSRVQIGYIGNISIVRGDDGGNIETVNNHRVNADWNVYATRNFFYSPLFLEYYRDPFQNIDSRVTFGTGVGYTIINTSKVEWRVSGGPAYQYVNYISVQQGNADSVHSGAIVLKMDYENEISHALDFLLTYDVTGAREESGGYTHHMIATLENDITERIDFDVSISWDRVSQPTQDAQDNVPEPDDYRLMIGLNWSF